MIALLAMIAFATSVPLSAQSPHRKPAVAATPSPDLHGMQYLYGSAEAAAATRQAWAALTRYVTTAVKDHRANSVVLREGASLDRPAFNRCGNKPLAAVFDVDETVLLNEGFEYDQLVGVPGRPFDPRWRRWEQHGVHRVIPTPGAREALAAIRALGVTVVFSTNRDADLAVDTAQALNDAGLGPAVHKDTLFLRGDDNTGDLKDVRREWISDRFCVIAMAGDQLGDFSDLFNDPTAAAHRRDLPASGIAYLWGNGWFVMPNPVYGTALRGTAGDIFPSKQQWRDPGTVAPKEHHP